MKTLSTPGAYMQYTSFKKISIFTLVLLITGAIDSIRNLPTTALFGSTLVFFFLFSAIIFLIPVALVSAECASIWPDVEGGIYSWIKYAFGKKIAFLAIWLQWINTMVWYPTILSFIAATSTYLINPELAHNKLYLIGVILGVFWGLTGLALRGFHSSAKFASYCAIIGMIIPMIMIIVLAGIWLIQGYPIQIHFTSHTIFPKFQHSGSWISLTAIMTSFLGMELAAVHVNQIDKPQTNFPKAMLFSVILILATMIFGSLAIAFVLPKSQISLVAGVMDAFSNFFAVYHLSWMIPLITVMLLIGSLGSMINWIISPAKGLLAAANHGFLPNFLCKNNKYHVPGNLLITQAILVTLMCGGFLLLPSVNGFYWLFTDLSTQLYVLMYVLMFAAAFKIKKTYQHLPRTFAIPGGKLGYYLASGLGLIGCIITLMVGFIPPQESIDVGGAFRYELLFCGGIIIMLLPIIIFYRYHARQFSRAC